MDFLFLEYDYSMSGWISMWDGLVFLHDLLWLNVLGKIAYFQGMKRAAHTQRNYVLDSRARKNSHEMTRASSVLFHVLFLSSSSTAAICSMNRTRAELIGEEEDDFISCPIENQWNCRLFNILTCFIKSYKEFLLRIASKVLVSQQYLSSKTGLIYLNYVHVHVQFWATNWCFSWLWMVKMKSYMLRINVGRHF